MNVDGLYDSTVPETDAPFKTYTVSEPVASLPLNESISYLIYLCPLTSLSLKIIVDNLKSRALASSLTNEDSSIAAKNSSSVFEGVFDW